MSHSHLLTMRGLRIQEALLRQPDWHVTVVPRGAERDLRRRSGNCLLVEAPEVEPPDEIC